jgi:uncharacterized protein
MPPEEATSLDLASAPVNPGQRLDCVDILRGIALLGVLAVNVVNEFRVSIFEQFLPAAPAPALDAAVQTVLTTAVELKAFALFSMLFGLGLAIQYERLGKSPHRLSLLVRRLVILLTIGLVHLLFVWNGDILTEYSLAGLFVLPFLWGPRWPLAMGAAVFLALYLAMPLLPPIVAWPTTTWIRHHVAEARDAYGTGDFLNVLAFRLRETPSMLPLHVFIFPRTIALFLFGMLVWRTDIIRCPAKHRFLLRSIAIVGVVAGGTLAIAVESQALSALGAAQFSIQELSTVLLAIGYGAAIIYFADTPVGKRMLAWAAPLGRMAFTNYLAQSVVFGWIFYGYGLGLFGRVGAATALAIGICVYIVQVLISIGWLRYFRFGPVEWIWRTLMYGTPQRMRHHRPSAW